MRRRRVWLSIAAGLAVLVAAVLLGLPALVRWYAIRSLEDLTGRQAAIADVDVNLFTRRLVMVDVQVAGAGDVPLARLARLEARFRLLPLVRSRLHLDRLRLIDPAVRIVRASDGRLTAADVLAHYRAREPSPEPTLLTVEHLSLDGGRVVFDDRAVEPAHVWRLDALTAEGQNLTTTTDAAEGTLNAAFRLQGAPGTVRAEHIGLRPPVRLVARVSQEPVDLGPLADYLRGSPVVLAGGRVGGTHTVRMAGDAVIVEDSQTRVTDLVLSHPGQDEPVLTADAVVMSGRDIRWQDGQWLAGRLAVNASPMVTDGRGASPRHYEIRDLHLVVEEAGYPTGEPGRLTLSASLPSGGTIEAQGTVRAPPFGTEGTVRLARIDAALARPYLPPAAPVTIDRGRLAATLQVSFAAPARLAVGGDFGLTDLVLLRRGQRQPFIRHQRLRGTITGLRLDGGEVSVDRLALSGAPTVVDASVSPPQRFDVQALSLVVEKATWPARAPARVEGMARLSGGASARLRGAVNVATLGVDVRATFADIDLRRFRGYLQDAPVALLAGTTGATIHLTHDRRAGLHLDGRGEIRDLALAPREQPGLTVSDPGLAFTIADLHIDDGAVAARRVAVTGKPTIVDRTGPQPRAVETRELSLALERLTWPGGGPAQARVAVLLPESGRLEAQGSVDLAARTFALTIAASDAALAPYAAFIPSSPPVGGRLDAEFSVQGALRDPLRLQAAGQMAAHEVRLGAAEASPITVERIQATGIDLVWPERLQVDRVLIAEPQVLVERTAEGRFPLRAMLAPAERAEAQAEPMPAALPRESRADGPTLVTMIDELSIEDGQARFIDRTTTPFYSEELTDLHLTVRDLGTAREGPGRVTLHALLGADAALELHGVVDPFGRPFFLELQGELQRFSVPRTNPYLRRFLDWIARSGELSTQLHYRIVGTTIEGSNDIVVQGIDVERAPGEEVGRAIGLPLALLVSILKNPAGDIRLSIPISGELGSPDFNFGDAIATALRNLVSRVVTGPFAAIGRLFRSDPDEPAALEVEPVEFPAGGATVGDQEARHLQRVADFLRAAPYVGLTLQPVVTEEDLTALRAQQVAARIQQVQQEQGLDFASAAIQVYRRRFPDRPGPSSVNTMLEELRGQATLPPEEADRLAGRRVEATRHHLVHAAGIQPDRLHAVDAAPIGAAGAPRVEFELKPE